MNYYSHHIGDYLVDTAHLSILEDGVYRRLMDRYYTTEQAITADEQALFRVLRARTEDEKDAVRVVLAEFFVLTDAGWTHKRCESEIAAYKAKSEKAKESANQRWNKGSNADAMPSQSERNADAMLTNNQEPITINQKPVKEKTSAAPKYSPIDDLIAKGVDSQIAADWITVRKGKKAAATKTSIDEVLLKITSAGLTIDAGLRICCERGWAGFNSEWLQNSQARASPAAPYESAKDRSRREASAKLTGRGKNEQRDFIDIDETGAVIVG